MDSELGFTSRRSPVLSTRGMVATSQPLAVAAGLAILSQGGNAADAAVATAAALNVTEPTSTGLGGDCFALYYDAKTMEITAINGSGRAPANLNLARLQKEGLGDELPPFHPYTVTVPGACAGWCDLLERHGQLDRDKVLAPAIQLAEQGFPVSPITAYFWDRGVDRQLSHTHHGHELTINGHAPKPGEIFRNPGLARTLRAVAERGKGPIYEGEIAEAIVAELHEAGGCMTLEDLEAHESTWEQPISTTYRDLRIWECPPNGQGLAALIALNILEGFDLQGLPPLSPRRLHLEIEAMRLGFADARWYITDPTHQAIPIEGLLSKEYAAERRRLIDLDRATLDQKFGLPVAASDTVYLSVVDEDGNACSFINSNYNGFGTGIVPKGYGFSLQNRGSGFNLEPEHPNVVAPRKRPYHTIIPALATYEDDGTLFACFGVMGGFMQPQGHVQVIVGLVDDGLDPQETLDRPRFCIGGGKAEGQVALEMGVPVETMASLAAMGHPVAPVKGYGRSTFGRGQIIQRDRANGVFWGGSDSRADGCVMSLV
jgi:gamma-glutamyltranspeptidase/glutathione hydrolase